MIVVSDSTILIGLAKIEKIALLRSLFQAVYIPEAVFQEVTEAGEQRPGAPEVREFE
jgi:predicted nucleic acid-binding protein